MVREVEGLEKGDSTVKARVASERNALCDGCLRSCRQNAGVLLVECPRYLPRPFKVPSYRFDQLDLFGEK